MPPTWLQTSHATSTRCAWGKKTGGNDDRFDIFIGQFDLNLSENTGTDAPEFLFGEFTTQWIVFCSIGRENFSL
jgi:hypothetical protein